MINEKQKVFIELWANKEKSGMIAEEIAIEVGVTKKTLYNWLKVKEITEEINKIAVANLDAVIPAIAHQTEKMINSGRSSDVVKGAEMFFKIQDKLQMKESLNSRSVEMVKFEKGIELFLNALPELFGVDEIGLKLASEMFGMAVIGDIRRNPIKNITDSDIDKFLREHGAI